MAQIKKIYDDVQMTNQVYPQTHVKAVVDNNGNTVESKLGALQDMINMAQWEAGEIEIDTAPTKGNTTHAVTSDGIYNSLDVGFSGSDVYDVKNDKILDRYITTRIYNNGSAYSSSNDRAVLLLPPLEEIKEITISSSIEYMLHYLSNVSDEIITPTTSTSFTYIGGTSYMSGENTVTVPSNATRVDIQFKTTNKDTLLSSISKLECLCFITKKVITSNDVVNDKYEGGEGKVLSAERGKELQLEVKNINYITGSPKATFDDLSSTGATNTSIIDVTLDSSTKAIKFDAVGSKTSQRYAWVSLPSELVNGKSYKLIADCEALVDSGCDGYVALTKSTDSSGYQNIGFNVANGKSSVCYVFKKTSDVKYIMTASNSVGGRLRYIYLSNIQFYTDYDNLQSMTDKVQDLIWPYTEATQVGYYKGNKIPPLSSWRIGCKKLMTSQGSVQAGTAYGNYYFIFNNQHSTMYIYNLATKTSLGSVSMTSGSKDHCNTCSFGNIFYDQNDDFPLIYTSGSQDGNYNHIQVWRIQLIESTFSISKVQEITLPSGAEGNIWHWGQAFLDNEKNHLWYASSSSDLLYFSRFSVPSIFDDNDDVISSVTLAESDRTDYFTTYKMANQQGGVMKNGILYWFDGVPAWGTLTKLYVYDIWGKNLINIVDIYNTLNITEEFEGAGIYNDTLVANVIGGTSAIYEIYF